MTNKMIDISVSGEFKAICTSFAGISIQATITNTEYNARLWEEIGKEADRCRSLFTADTIKDFPPIQATRAAYKSLGKDPSRYRPSSEALCRRVLRGLGLYKVNTAVDLVNLVSMRSGLAIGGFDADKIAGRTLQLGIGRDGEPYEAIGRGSLNIDRLPVYRDSVGGIGTPTSDNERTKIDLGTVNLLLIVNSYGGGFPTYAAQDLEMCLKEYAGATDIAITQFE